MSTSDLLFYGIATFTLLSGFLVLIMANPIYSALMLALTMVGVSGIFFHLGAYFVAGAQLIIYAGAVIVLFVMVVMLFDLKREKRAFSSSTMGMIVKLGITALLLAFFWSGFDWFKTNFSVSPISDLDTTLSTKNLAMHLFTKYMIGFEVIGVLLLVVLIGAITLARAKGGTHA